MLWRIWPYIGAPIISLPIVATIPLNVERFPVTWPRKEAIRMAHLLSCFLIGVAVLLACGPRASAAAVDCGKPVLPCTACHNPMLTQTYSNCAAEPWTAPPEAKELHSPLVASPKVIAEGKANYEIYCEGCHGPRADGAGPIAMKFSIPVTDLTTPEVQQQSDGELFWKLSHGYGAMPMWRDMLSDDNRWQLIAFIRSFKKSQ